MNISITPRGVVDSHRTEPGIIDLKNAGFTRIALDTTMFAPPAEPELLNKKSYRRENRIYTWEQPEELCIVMKNYCNHVKSHDMNFSVAIGTRQIYGSELTILNDTLYRLNEQTILLAAANDTGYAVIYPLLKGYERGREWEVNRDFYLKLGRLAKEKGVKLLLTNCPYDMQGHLIRGICCEPAEAVQWLERLNNELPDTFGFCLDIGIMTLCGQEPYEVITALGDRIDAVIVRDMDGSRDIELLPFMTSAGGAENPQTDWLSVFRGLRRTGFDGELILTMDTTACCVSTIYKPALLNLSYETIKYIRWQIELENLIRKYPKRVLFGAGNMCRNYMKNYGEEFPPLFTCDNNSSRWGEEFCGLTIKAPDELKKLPPDCAVFICNVYYREIEAQLRSMGIKNPIEYFNDEYMPTFYTERIDMAIEATH